MKRLKAPAKIRIKRGVEYDVFKFKKPELHGEIVFEDRAIFLHEDLSAAEEESTLLHEVLHGICHHYKVGLTEKQVLKLEKGLVSFIRLNRKWLAHEEG